MENLNLYLKQIMEENRICVIMSQMFSLFQLIQEKFI
nr:MAG TPA: hypothetical protein [Bacteriophage sp.]DAT16699.1 MAG TPA: hypothetical protein [Caudoviricetes sp.]